MAVAGTLTGPPAPQWSLSGLSWAALARASASVVMAMGLVLSPAPPAARYARVAGV
jgi:hypothetical protein